jgi:hypothetical protein
VKSEETKQKEEEKIDPMIWVILAVVLAIDLVFYGTLVYGVIWTYFHR